MSYISYPLFINNFSAQLAAPIDDETLDIPLLESEYLKLLQKATDWGVQEDPQNSGEYVLAPGSEENKSMTMTLVEEAELHHEVVFVERLVDDGFVVRLSFRDFEKAHSFSANARLEFRMCDEVIGQLLSISAANGVLEGNQVSHRRDTLPQSQGAITALMYSYDSNDDVFIELPDISSIDPFVANQVQGDRYNVQWLRFVMLGEGKLNFSVSEFSESVLRSPNGEFGMETQYGVVTAWWIPRYMYDGESGTDSYVGSEWVLESSSPLVPVSNPPGPEE